MKPRFAGSTDKRKVRGSNLSPVAAVGMFRDAIPTSKYSQDTAKAFKHLIINLKS